MLWKTHIPNNKRADEGTKKGKHDDSAKVPEKFGLSQMLVDLAVNVCVYAFAQRTYEPDSNHSHLTG